MRRKRNPRETAAKRWRRLYGESRDELTSERLGINRLRHELEQKAANIAGLKEELRMAMGKIGELLSVKQVIEWVPQAVVKLLDARDTAARVAEDRKLIEALHETRGHLLTVVTERNDAIEKLDKLKAKFVELEECNRRLGERTRNAETVAIAKDDECRLLEARLAKENADNAALQECSNALVGETWRSMAERLLRERAKNDESWIRMAEETRALGRPSCGDMMTWIRGLVAKAASVEQAKT